MTLNYVGSIAAVPVHVTDVDATNQAASGVALQVGQNAAAPMIIDRVRGDATGGGIGLKVTQNSGSPLLLRNSIGRTTADSSTAIYVVGPTTGSGSVDVRNVLGDARNANGGLGFLAQSGGVPFTSCGNLTVTLKNSYMRSAYDPRYDLAAVGYYAVSQCTSTVQSSNSNYRDSQVQLGGIITPTNDQHVDALFANAAGGDYRELAGSPTIDAGVIDDQVGSLDYYGSPRITNGKIDVGAAEFQPPPAPDTTAPVGSALAFKPTSFLPTAKAPPAGSAKKKAKTKRGTKISYRVNEAATVVFTVERKLKGRKQGKKCKTKALGGQRAGVRPGSFLPAAKAPPAGSARRKARRGTTIGYRMSEPATVVFTVSTQAQGTQAGQEVQDKP